MPRSVLMVSKPVAPPWNDSSKNLVKDLALAGSAFSYHLLTPAGYRLDGPSVRCEPIYAPASAGAAAHSPRLAQNLRVLRRLLQRDQTRLAHFFFAPNPRTSTIARLALRLRPRRSVQTVCSCPSSFERPQRLLFADRVVVLSQHARRCFVAAGVDEQRLSVIRPGITLPEPPSAERRAAIRQRHRLPLDHALVIYPGDYQFSRAADTVARAVVELAAAGRRPDTTFVFACRIKQDASRAEQQRIRRQLGQAGVLDRVRFYNQVPDMLDLLAACDLCLLPAESLYAKMDLPLVLVEALALGVPLVVADQPPLSEILVDEVGLAVAPRDPHALASAVAALLDNPAHRATLAATAQRAARTCFDIRRVCRQYEELYEEVLRG